MMQRMHCTYTEYLAQPVDVMCVFEAFVRGEAEAQRILKEAADAVKQTA